MTLSAAIAALVVLFGIGWLFGYALRPQRERPKPSPRGLEPYRSADRDVWGDFPSSHDLRGRR